MSTTVNCRRSIYPTRAITKSVESLPSDPENLPAWARTQAVLIDGPNVREIYAAASPAPSTDTGSQNVPIAQTVERLADLLELSDASLDDIVTLDLFIHSSARYQRNVRDLIGDVLPEACCREVLYVDPVAPTGRITLQAYAVRPHIEVPFSRREFVVDARWDTYGVELEYGGFRHYFVVGIPGFGAEEDSLEAHCDLMFARADRALVQEGYSIHNVQRTHLYYDGPYQDLRNARHTYFGKLGVTDAGLPASTGVPAFPQYGRSVMRLHAVQATGETPLVSRCVEPRTQSQAFEYGSLFARARWIETDVAKLEVSGTASMGRNGRVIYKGRPKQQAAKTRENVMDLVARCGLDVQDLVRHIVYVCQPRHFDPWCDELHAICPGGREPGVISAVKAGVCWNDLTVEEEATAVSLRLPSNSG